MVKPVGKNRNMINKIKSKLKRMICNNIGGASYDPAHYRLCKMDTHRIVPRNCSVYDSRVYGKYDLKTQVIVPEKQAKDYSFNLDSILQYAQSYHREGRSNFSVDRVPLTAGYIPKGEGLLLDACTSAPLEPVRESAIRNGYTYQAIDICPGHPDVRQENLCALTFEDESVSAVVSVDTLEHIEDLNSALSEIYRVLSNDGVFITHVPCYYFSKEESEPVDADNDPYGHVRYFSGPDLVSRIFEAGFIPLRISQHLDYGALVVVSVKCPDIFSGR